MELWGYLIVALFVFVLIRAWFVLGKVSKFIDHKYYLHYEEKQKKFL